MKRKKETEVLYARFSGVDFTTDATATDPRRSPDAENLIADRKGFPEKRPGWRYVFRWGETVHGLFSAVFSDGTAVRLAHIGTKLYEWSDAGLNASPVAEGLADGRSRAFSHGGALYLLDGGDYRVLRRINGAYALTKVKDEATVPLIRTAITGNVVTIMAGGKSFGGHTYTDVDAPNLLTDRRRCEMVGDGQSTEFFLPEQDVDGVLSLTVNGRRVTSFTLKKGKGKLVFSSAPAASPEGLGRTNILAVYARSPKKRETALFTGDGHTADYLLPAGALTVPAVTVDGTETESFSFDEANRTVTLTEAPAADAEVLVTYTVFDPDAAPERITGCRLADAYGDCFFLAGEANAAYRNADYGSAPCDPAYFPETGRARIGEDTSRVMGYLKQYGGQLILKEDSASDAQVYLRTAETGASAAETPFTVKQGVRGPGAVSFEANVVLTDEPLFFSREGVFAVVSDRIASERSTVRRSYYVDARLKKEPHPERAAAAAVNGRLVLSLNGRAYVMENGTDGPCWTYWTNVPASFFYTENGALYFAAEDGVCRFNTDIERLERFADGAYPNIRPGEMTEEERQTYEALPDGEREAYRRTLVRGVPVAAVWSTRAESFGTFAHVKSLKKRGCAVLVKPYTRSSVQISVRTDRDGERSLGTRYADILDFTDIDFGRFTFRTQDLPTVLPLNRRVKKFIVLQLTLRSDGMHEGFGVYGIRLAAEESAAVK